MSILDDASHVEIVRLLELFPLPTLRATWGEVKGTKGVICEAAAKEHDLGKIIGFVQANFGRCRMHVHVLESDTQSNPLSAITGAEVIQATAGGPVLVIAKASFVVILQESMKKETVNLLWPMRIEAVAGHTVLSLIVLERKPGAMFEESVSVVSRSLDEKLITKQLTLLGFKTSNLHKGMKALWAEDYMDAFRTKFRSPDSTLAETMDEEKGIKANKPERYEELKGATMFMTFFHFLEESVKSMKDFMIDPSKGYIGFPRYTDDAGDADEVVRALLTKNS